MRVLVTGGNGFIGHHLVNRLLAAGHDVDVMDDLSSFEDEPTIRLNKNDRLTFRTNNIVDVRPDLDFGSYGTIFHLAAMSRVVPSVRDPDKTILTNVYGTTRILDLAERCGAKVVFASSCTVYRDVYANPYATSKLVAEDIVRTYRVRGVDAEIVRIFNVFGPGQYESGPFKTLIGIYERLYREQKEAGEKKIILPVRGSGTQRRSYVHVHDVVSALIKIAQTPEGMMSNVDRLFAIRSSDSYDVNTIVEMFGAEALRVDENDFEHKHIDEAESHIHLTRTMLLGWAPTITLKDYIDEFRRSC